MDEEIRMRCPECEGAGIIHDVDRADEYDCPICDGAGTIDPVEHVASNRLRRIREILGAADEPYQTEVSAAHGVMARIDRLRARIAELEPDAMRVDAIETWLRGGGPRCFEVQCWPERGDRPFVIEHRGRQWTATLRAAIDAATKGT